MEVVVLCVSERNQEADDVDERCTQSDSLLDQASATASQEHLRVSGRVDGRDLRLAEGFLPMYFFW